MSLAHESDTIAAIATPMGEGGISVIRISGASAIRIADRGFKENLARSRRLAQRHYGRFTNKTGDDLDNVVVGLRTPLLRRRNCWMDGEY